MILVDTSVIISFLRTPNPKWRRAMSDNDAAICGVVRAEVLHGARDAVHLRKLRAAIGKFKQLPIEEYHWDVLGQNLALLRAAGITVPFADALVATVAIEREVDLWTLDAHFAAMQRVLPALRLFVAPP